MTADRVQLPFAAVRQHAGAVDQAADAVRQARSAVGQVTMDTEAYGQLCQFLPTLLTPVFELAVGALNGSADALQETATALREAVSSTEATDTAAARRVTSSGRPLLELPL